jgi:hypothetical protein
MKFFHRQIIANFTEGNIPSVYTEGITMKKKEIKTRLKGTMMCIYGYLCFWRHKDELDTHIFSKDDRDIISEIYLFWSST